MEIENRVSRLEIDPILANNTDNIETIEEIFTSPEKNGVIKTLEIKSPSPGYMNDSL